MKSLSNALLTLLNSGTEFYVVDLLTITPVNMSAVYLTSSDRDVTVNGHTFSSAGPTFGRTPVKLTRGLAVDALTLPLFPQAGNTLGGLSWPQAARLGLLDNATVRIDRAYMATATDLSAGTVWVYSGKVGQAKAFRNTIELEVQADTERLSLQMPRNLYQPGCVHTLYDAGCTLVKATYTSTLTATAGSTASTINASTALATGLFDLGVLTFTSGVNAGLPPRPVKTFTTGGSFLLAAPFPQAPAAGDTFTVTQGCDKSQATCSGKFSNLSHFRGYPYIPKAETAR